MVTLVACTSGGVSTPAPTPTPPSAATASPDELGPPQPEAARIEEHIRFFTQEIGPRLAGSTQEQEAIEYAREQFERWGYVVEVQTFTATAPSPLLAEVSFTVEVPEQRKLPAAALEGSSTSRIDGPLVDAGTGREEEFGPETAGAVVLIQRKDVPFTEMARRAQEAGALGVVIANREAGLFPGQLETKATLPVIAIDRAGGEALRELLAEGSVEVSVRIREEVIAHNVIARPEDGECRTLSGGHYDTVPWTVGANDNASGAALVLELARAAAAAGLTDHCFALFGAEEQDLQGSVFFVSGMSAEELGALTAYFNYDVVAGDDRPVVIGDSGLQARAKTLADQAGLDVGRGALSAGAGSDHVSFIEADIPALMLTMPDFQLLHTPQDTLVNLNPASLEIISSLGFALIQSAVVEP